MVRDITSDMHGCLSAALEEAIDALSVLNKHFGRETQSAALGEVSESLIASYVGGTRRKRNTKGHDVYKGDQLIEVKSRVINDYGDTTQFNFRKYTADAHIAYCLGWRIDENRPLLQHVFEVGVPFLIGTWAKPNQPIYCARTTLRKLRAAAKA